MLTHAQIWNAIDTLAARHGLSASGLARKAGLDATTFNKSKRVTGDGRARWPSTESVAKVLEATGDSIDVFLGLLDRAREAVPRRIPMLSLAQAAADGLFDEAGHPRSEGWDEAIFPGPSEERIYALEVAGGGLEPPYRHGDLIIVAPGVQIRKGDRVVVRTRAGEVLAMALKRRTARTAELAPLGAAGEERALQQGEIAWMARIVWASQ